MSDLKQTKASDAAMRAAESLFVNGFNEEAERLVLWQDSTQRNLGGWCRGAVADRIETAIEESRRAPSPAVRALVEACRTTYSNLAQDKENDWRAFDEAIAAVEREIGQA